MPNRKLFSKKDGTTFVEDVDAMSQEVKAFFNGLPAKLKKWMYESSKIVTAIQNIDAAIAEGQPADKAIDFVLSNIKGEVDEHLYEAIRKALHQIVEYITANQYSIPLCKLQCASAALIEVSELTQLEADTVTQVAVYSIKA